MTDPWRCPDCGCLAVTWSRAHSPKCVYGVTPAHERQVLDELQRTDAALDRIAEQLDRWADACPVPTTQESR